MKNLSHTVPTVSFKNPIPYYEHARETAAVNANLGELRLQVLLFLAWFFDYP